MTRIRLARSFAVVLERASDDGDGRTVSGRVVPYGETATVDDGDGPYPESFQYGAFRRAVKAPNRVLLGFEHHNGIAGVCGHGTHMTEERDGLHGVFRVLPGPVGDTALELIDAEVVTGFSVGFVPFSTRSGPDGERIRTACHLDEVSLCRTPAFAGAAGIGVRSEDPLVAASYLDEWRRPSTSDIDERLRNLGIAR